MRGSICDAIKIEHLITYQYLVGRMITIRLMGTRYTLLAGEQDIFPYKDLKNFSPTHPLEIDEEMHRLVLRCLQSGIEYEHIHHSENKIYMIDRLNYLLHELVVSHTKITAIISTTPTYRSIESSTRSISADDIYVDDDLPIDMNAEYVRYITLLDEAKEHILKW